MGEEERGSEIDREREREREKKREKERKRAYDIKAVIEDASDVIFTIAELLHNAGGLFIMSLLRTKT